MSDALKPCPFCGGSAELDTMQAFLALGSGRPGRRTAIYCAECSADIGICHADVPELDDEARTAYVVELWNRRSIPAGYALVPRKIPDAWLEIGRKAVEDTLIEWRDSRLSELGRRNGLVVAESDGTPSPVIRFGMETAFVIAWKAMIAAAQEPNL